MCYPQMQGVIFFRQHLAFNKLQLLPLTVCGEFENRV